MTLKEKLQQVTYWWREATECELIADDYAIEFSEWMMSKCNSIEPEGSFKGKYFLLHKGDFFTTLELLEIFKKEKRL